MDANYLQILNNIGSCFVVRCTNMRNALQFVILGKGHNYSVEKASLKHHIICFFVSPFQLFLTNRHQLVNNNGCQSKHRIRETPIEMTPFDSFQKTLGDRLMGCSL